MSISRSRLSSQDTQHSDALADIALNTLGLILIVMLVYILMFRQTTQKVSQAAQSRESRLQLLDDVTEENETLRQQLAGADPDQLQRLRQQLEESKANATKNEKQLVEHESRFADLESELDKEQAKRKSLEDRLEASTGFNTALTNEKKELSQRIVSLEGQLAMSEKSRNGERETARRLQEQIKDLETRVSTLAEGSRMTGLWRFRNDIVQLVDHNDNTESVDWTIDYYLYLNVVDDKVTGALFGAHEIETAEEKSNSQSYAKISGTVSKSGFLDVELTFSQGTLDTGSEHLRCRFVGNEFVGRLESGRHRYGFRNYVGSTKGTRLTESVFK